MNYDQVMSGGVTAGTTLHNKRKKRWYWVGWGAGILFLAGNLIWSSDGSLKTYTQEKRAQKPAQSSVVSQGASIPLASADPATWPKLAMSPKGRSETIPIPPGKRLSWAGSKFLVHTIYTDGRECAFGQNCPDGALVGAYATNEANETNVVSYALALD